MKITFDELDDMGFESVTDYCRECLKYKEIGRDWSLEVYRGEMLCLTVKSIEEGAKLEPCTDGRGFRPYRADRSGGKPADAFK